MDRNELKVEFVVCNSCKAVAVVGADEMQVHCARCSHTQKLPKVERMVTVEEAKKLVKNGATGTVYQLPAEGFAELTKEASTSVKSGWVAYML